MGRLGVALGLGIAALLIGARMVNEWVERQRDDRDGLTLHFVNETGLAANYEIDSDRFTGPVFVGGHYFGPGSSDYPWVSSAVFQHALPVAGFGGPGEWLSLEGAPLVVRITLRDEAHTLLATDVELRGGSHVECKLTKAKQLETRHGALGILGIDWEAD